MMATNMSKICITLLLVLMVLSSAAQDGEKKTFKAFGTDWRIFGVNAFMPGGTNNQVYKTDLSAITKVVSSEDKELENMRQSANTKYVKNGGISDSRYFLSGTVIIKPMVLSTKKLLSKQDIKIGLSYLREQTDYYVTVNRDKSQDVFEQTTTRYNLLFKQVFLDAAWTIRTPTFGPDMVAYTGIGVRASIADFSEIQEVSSTADYRVTNNGREQITDAEVVEKFHYLQPHTSANVYVPIGIKVYISCRVNFVAETSIGWGSSYFKPGKQYGYNATTGVIGIQYKFQKPVKLDNEKGEKEESDKPGVFW